MSGCVIRCEGQRSCLLKRNEPNKKKGRHFRSSSSVPPRCLLKMAKHSSVLREGTEKGKGKQQRKKERERETERERERESKKE